MISVAVMGASGRTGRRVVAAVLESPETELIAGFSHAGSASLGMDCGLLAGLGPCDIHLTTPDSSLLARADVVIDFSLPKGLEELLTVIGNRPLVTGTTGLSAGLKQSLNRQAEQAAVLTAACSA